MATIQKDVNKRSGTHLHIIPYHSSEILEKYENKGNQLLWGVIVGLGTQILQEVLSKKK